VHESQKVIRLIFGAWSQPRTGDVDEDNIRVVTQGFAMSTLFLLAAN
jgi:hypothetical protein